MAQQTADRRNKAESEFRKTSAEGDRKDLLDKIKTAVNDNMMAHGGKVDIKDDDKLKELMKDAESKGLLVDEVFADTKIDKKALDAAKDKEKELKGKTKDSQAYIDEAQRFLETQSTETHLRMKDKKS